MNQGHKFNIIIPPQDIQENPECLAQVAAGNSDAFGWLYKNYCKKTYDYAFLLTGDQFLSDDIVQEVFLKVWKSREQLQSIKSFNNWLHTLTRNHILDCWRTEKRQKAIRLEVANDQTDFIQPNYDDKENRQLIAEALSSLSQRQQLIYKLIREEGLTRDEVSKGLKISPCTVKATMQNALAALRQKLKHNVGTVKN